MVRELSRKLEGLGCWGEAPALYRRQGQGVPTKSGKTPATGAHATVPGHGNQDVRTGTLHKIRRDLGISRLEFDQA